MGIGAYLGWSWLEWAGMGWSGFGAVTILVTNSRFWPFRERRDSRNSLIPLFPERDSNPHEGNPHRILSPAQVHVKSNENL